MKTISFIKPLKTIQKDTVNVDEFTCAICGSLSGFENATPAQDGYQNPLSLDALFVQHPASTFFVKVGEESAHVSIAENKYLGVSSGDVLTVDRTLTPTLGRLVLAVCEGSFTLCRFTEHEGRQFLVCGDEKCVAQEVQEENDVYVWGVVCLHLADESSRTYGNDVFHRCPAQNVSRSIVRTTRSILLGRLELHSFA